MRFSPRRALSAALLCSSLAGCGALSSGGPPAYTPGPLASMPQRIRAEASRPPVDIPTGPLDNRQHMSLSRDLRVSELSYRRALIDAVQHADRVRQNAMKRKAK